MTNDFTFVWIGDPHLERNHENDLKYHSSVDWKIDGGQPNNWINQTNWIVRNIPKYNIQAVLCAGDMYMCFNPDPNCRPIQEPLVWDNGSGEGLVAIDSSGLPYLVAAGNHDMDCTGTSPPKTENRNTTSFDKYLGHDQICTKSWYVGYCQVEGGSKANQAIKFDVGGRHLLVIALEFFPRPEVLDWAANLAKQYYDCEVIIITHAYMTDAGDLFGTHAARYRALPPDRSSSRGHPQLR